MTCRCDRVDFSAFAGGLGVSSSGVKVCRSFDDLQALGESLHLALGVFDGVHIGHQAVIGRAVEAAEREGGLAGVLTFDPHPIRVIAPGKAPASLLETLDHKARICGALGATVFVALPFDEAMAALSAEDFVGRLVGARVRTLAVGEDWRFGRGRQGDVEFLRGKAEESGFVLEAVAPVMWDGERVSSSRIRQAVRDGNLEAAAEMLGRPYAVSGTVVEGRKLGRQLGFPTANLATGDLQLPPDGVWAMRVRLADGSVRAGVANLGRRPTVGEGLARALEIHLMDFSGDLYGQALEAEWVVFLRGEMKFGSIEELKGQIEADVRAALDLLGNEDGAA
jgi:riboflavin kinase/FMN adenylyltransferase